MGLLLLFALLSDPDFDTRQWATDRLTHLVDRSPWDYGERLAKRTRETQCPEARRRGLLILTSYDRWRANSYVPSTVPVWPCCDMIAAANPIVPFGLAPDVRDRAAGGKWYSSCGSPPVFTGGLVPGPYWSEYRRGTERMARRLIVDGATAAEVDAMLLRMWKVEQEARGDCTADRWRESESWTKWEGGYPQPPK